MSRGPAPHPRVGPLAVRLGRAELELAPVAAIRPAPIVAVAHHDVWAVRELSDLLQRQGMRVMLLSSAINALQLVATSRCDVLLLGDGLSSPSAPELCRLLREKLDGQRPWFVDIGRASRTPEERALFDARAGAADDLSVVVATAVRARRAALRPRETSRRRAARQEAR